MTRLLAICLLFSGLCAHAADIIPESRRTLWEVGNTVGYRGTRPADGTVWTITSYGGNTNSLTNLVTIATGSRTLTFANATGWAVSNGIFVSGQAFLITNLSGTTAILNGDIVTGGTNITAKLDNAPPANNLVSIAGQNDVVYFPSGTFNTYTWINVDRSNIKVRGHSNSLIATLGTGSISTGNGGLSLGTGKNAFVHSGGTRGSVLISLSPTNVTPAVGEMYTISTLNSYGSTNSDGATNRVIAIKGDERVIQQSIYITNVSGTNIGFTPRLVWDFTNAPFINQTITAVRTNVGFEGLTVIATNRGEIGSAQKNFLLQGLANYWFEGCKGLYSGNYNVHIWQTVHGDIRSNVVAHALTAGTSHALMLVEESSGLLIENTTFDSADFALQLWGKGSVGNAYVGLFFTNIIATCIAYHSAGHVMNLFEQCVGSSGAFLVDGYYGWNGYAVVHRNRFGGSMSIKRFSSYFSFTENHLGSTAYDFRYDRYESNIVANADIFYLGEPNIGNQNYTGTAPPMSANYPQTHFFGPHGTAYIDQKYFTNLSHTFTSNFTGSNLFLGSAATNWPYANTGEYVVIFQDASDTNRYRYAQDALGPIDQMNGSVHLIVRPYDWLTTTNSGIVTVGFTNSPPVTNLVFNRTFTASNGWTMLPAGPDAYQQLQEIDVETQIRHLNLIYTNSSAVGSVKNDPAIANTNLVTSYIYTNGPPAYMIGGWRNTLGDPNTTNRLTAERDYVSTEPTSTNPPSAYFTATPTNGARPLFVSFQPLAASSNSFAWNFGNGSTSAVYAPTHTYLVASNYTVTLVVANVYGASTNTVGITVTNTSEAATGTWVDALASLSGIGTNGMQSQDVYWQRITNTVTGSATAMRIYVDSIGSVTAVKGGLYNIASNKLASGSGYCTGVGYNEFQFDTATPVTNGAVYNVAYSAESTSFPYAYHASVTPPGVAGGASYYATMPLATLPTSGFFNVQGALAVGFNVTPEAPRGMVLRILSR